MFTIVLLFTGCITLTIYYLVLCIDILSINMQSYVEVADSQCDRNS